jgi:S-adenosyl-L-methionine hydrolase (adenosine-forming)
LAPSITIISDTQGKDYVIPLCKALFLQQWKTAHIIDITHHVQAHNLAEAAYISNGCIFEFPKYSFHLNLVGLFHEPHPQILLAYYNNQYIITANNGYLSLLIPTNAEWVVQLNSSFLKKPSTAQNIFLGIRKAVAHIHDGLPMQKIGDIPDNLIDRWPPKSTSGADWIDGHIIFIDAFDNIIINISKQQFETSRKNRPFKIIIRNTHSINEIGENYASASLGEPVAFFNTQGWLEIAINQGKAASLFGLQSYNTQIENEFLRNRMLLQTIRVQFFNT